VVARALPGEAREFSLRIRGNLSLEERGDPPRGKGKLLPGERGSSLGGRESSPWRAGGAPPWEAMGISSWGERGNSPREKGKLPWGKEV